jgi:hypothetical protein
MNKQQHLSANVLPDGTILPEHIPPTPLTRAERAKAGNAAYGRAVAELRHIYEAVGNNDHARAMLEMQKRCEEDPALKETVFRAGLNKIQTLVRRQEG